MGILPNMKDLIYLAQTDTTVGLLSQNCVRLNTIKQRDVFQKLIMSVDSFTTLNKFARIPKSFKKLVRNSKKSTFIYANNKAIRVVKDERHLGFLNKLKWCYTTSANLSGMDYDAEFAYENADVIVYDVEFEEKESSQIIKLGKIKCKQIR